MTQIVKQTTTLDVRQFGWLRFTVMVVFVNMSVCSTLHVATSQDFDIDDVKAGDAVLAASLLDGLLQNNLAITSFDVTYDAEYMVHKPDSRLTTSRLKVRYCKNEVEKGLFVRSRVADQFDTDQELHSTNTLSAFYLDSTPNVISIDATGKQVLKYQNLVVRNYRIGVPSFHSIGFLNFPHVAPFLPREDPHWTGLTVPNDDITAFIQSDQRAKVVEKRRLGDKVDGIAIWIFDLKTLLPEQRRYFYIDLAGKPKLKEVEDYTWKAFEGVNVPTRIRAEVTQIQVDKESGEHLPYSEIYSATLDWNSVNTAIQKELLERDHVATMQDVQALLNRSSVMDVDSKP